MEVVRTEPEALTGCRWMVILTTKPVVYKNAGHQDQLPKGATVNFLRKIILIAAVALAVSLGTAC